MWAKGSFYLNRSDTASVIAIHQQMLKEAEPEWSYVRDNLLPSIEKQMQ